MRLVLDEHFSNRISEELRRRGHDVIAVTERAHLRALGDEELLEWARGVPRVVVTADVGDFVPIHKRLIERGEWHHGIIFTSERRLSTHSRAIGTVVLALDAFLNDAAHAPFRESAILWM